MCRIVHRKQPLSGYGSWKNDLGLPPLFNDLFLGGVPITVFDFFRTHS